jgi:hypothetical protein
MTPERVRGSRQQPAALAEEPAIRRRRADFGGRAEAIDFDARARGDAARTRLRTSSNRSRGRSATVDSSLKSPADDLTLSTIRAADRRLRLALHHKRRVLALTERSLREGNHPGAARSTWRQYQRFREPLGAGAAEQAKQSLLDALKADRLHTTRKARWRSQCARDPDRPRRAPHAGRPQGRRPGALFKLDNNGEAKFDSVGRRHNVILGMAHARMESLLDRFRRSRLFGDKLRLNRAQLATSCARRSARTPATRPPRASPQPGRHRRRLRQRFNAAGGAIGKLDNWGLPQWHDARGAAQPRPRGSGRPTSRRCSTVPDAAPADRRADPAGELDEILDGIWQASSPTAGTAARRRQRFGQGRARQPAGRAPLPGVQGRRHLAEIPGRLWRRRDPFAAMMGHVNMMARDIAAMEILGPNPGAGRRVHETAGRRRRRR